MSGSTGERWQAGVPAVGELIAQKYRVEGVVGTGGMGVVVSARHLQLGQVVAIKLLTLPPDEDRRDEAIARFLHEAQAAAGLRSDHVVRLYDVGQLDSGLPFMVMELLSGTDLGSLLDEQGPLPEAQAVDFVLQACAGVAEAHRMGIVHRDLKPSNLFVTTRSDGLPLLKVLDFGISKQLTDPASGEVLPTFTSTRTLMGSPNYMSPEQIRDARRVDVRTDIWALGIILQELLTDAPVFGGESFPGICAAIVADQPLPVRTLRPDVSRKLELVIERCLQKDPQQRFQSIDELVGALAGSGARASLGSAAFKPVVYSSGPPLAGPRSRTQREQPRPGADAATISVSPQQTSTNATLESARLPGATQISLASTDSRIEIVTPKSPLPLVRHGRWLAWSSLVAGGAVALVWLFRPTEPAPSAPQPSANASVAPVAEPIFALTLDLQPAGATVTENGVLLGATPLTLTLPQSSPTRVFVISKEGYEPHVLHQAGARGEVNVRGALVPSPVAAPAPSALGTPDPPATSKPAGPLGRAPARVPSAAAPKPPSDIRLER